LATPLYYEKHLHCCDRYLTIASEHDPAEPRHIERVIGSEKVATEIECRCDCYFATKRATDEKEQFEPVELVMAKIREVEKEG
jgi:hypothetical protein